MFLHEILSRTQYHDGHDCVVHSKQQLEQKKLEYKKVMKIIPSTEKNVIRNGQSRDTGNIEYEVPVFDTCRVTHIVNSVNILSVIEERKST